MMYLQGNLFYCYAQLMGFMHLLPLYRVIQGREVVQERRYKLMEWHCGVLN